MALGTHTEPPCAPPTRAALARRRLAAPLYGALFYAESVNPATASMPLSQRLIHTRVYGQALVIGITAAVMALGKSMEQDGAYVLYEGRVVREAEVARKGPKLRHWYSEGLDKHKDLGAPASDAEEIGLSYDLLVPLLCAHHARTRLVGQLAAARERRLSSCARSTTALRNPPSAGTPLCCLSSSLACAGAWRRTS